MKNHLGKWLDRPCEDCSKQLFLENSSIDHIKPLSLAKTEGEIIELNQLSNLRLVCRPCNSKKGDRYGV